MKLRDRLLVPLGLVFPFVTLLPFLGAQTATLESFTSVRNGSSTSYPLWSVYTGPGAGDNLCTTQSWAISGGSGTSTWPNGSCPYIYSNAGLPAGFSDYNFPEGYAQNFLASGTWSTAYNRLTYTATSSVAIIQQNTTATANGSFIRPHGLTGTGTGSEQGQHYYHFFENAFKPGVTYYVTLNAHPQHERSGASAINWPNDPEYVNPTAFNSDTGTRGPVHYLDGLTSWYINHIDNGGTLSAGTFSVGPVQFSTITGEPDEDISSITAAYDGTSYLLDLSGPKNVTENYTIHTSSSSMHTNGFSSGTDRTTCSGSNPTAPGSSYTGVHWQCTMAQSGNLYVAIKPMPAIISTSGNGVSPIRAVFAADPMFTASTVTVAGVGGNTAANGTWSYTAHPRRFWGFGGVALATGLTSVVTTGSVATINTTSAHNLVVGDQVMVWWYEDPTTSGQWSYGNLFPVKTVPSSTSFTITTTEDAATYTSSNAANLQIWSMPSLDLTGSTGNGAYTSGGTATSTSNTADFTEVMIPGTGSNLSTSPCDINKDGVVNLLDVQLITNQVVGATACTNDLNGDGLCNIIDFQRVVNAALGGQCVTGP